MFEPQSTPVVQPASQLLPSIADVSNCEFISAIFKTLPEGAEPVLCSFYGDPKNQKTWTAQPVGPVSSQNNNFFAVGSFYPKNGTLRAVTEQAAAAHVIFLDDVGTKVPLERLAKLPPSYLIETSPDNFQAGYILKKPLTKREADTLLRAIIDARLSDPSATGSCTRWARLPDGVNGKPKHTDADGRPFQCRLKEWRPDARYSPQQIIEGLDLSLTQKPLSERAKATAPSIIADDRKARFGAAALEQECAIISSTVEGSRNSTLTNGAIKIGSIIASDCLDEHAAKNALLSAAMHSGLSKAEATATINSAIGIGKKNPRHPSERPIKKVCDTMQEPQSPDTEPKGDEGAKKVTEELLEIADDFEIFCDLSGEAYATLRETGETITAQLASRYIKDILVTEYFEKTGKLAGETQVKLVIELLSAKARRAGDRRKVNLRVGEHNGAIYLDLGKRFVEISERDWSIIDEAPIPFRRPPAMQALPEPISGGSIHQLKPFLNIATEQDFQLVIAFAHAALRPVGPFPILCVTGENGSAKSSVCELLARLIDPQSGHKLKIGNSEDQTFVLGENRWIMDFDNLSGISPEASDALCRIATGASLSKRKLYSDGDQHLSTICRPIIANGIDSIATRNDFADRAIVISLRRIPEGDRRPEEDIRREFAQAQPAILGALLDGIVEGLRRCSSIKLAKLPRMADFARWAAACETAHWPDGGFERAYFANAALAGDDVLANDEVAQALIEFMENRSEWSGTAAELKTRLEESVPEKVINDRMLWPRRANDIGKRLTRIQTALRRYGIEVDRTRAGGGIRTRTITIRHSEPEIIQQNEGIGTTTEDLGQEGQEIKISCPYHKQLIEKDLHDLGTRGTTNSPKTFSVPTKQKWRVEL